MINVQNKQKDETFNTFFAPSIAKRQKHFKKPNRFSFSNQKQENIQIRENKSCPQMQKKLSPPYSQFKNKLLSYLEQSQKQDRKHRENLEQQHLIKLRTWFYNKKQSNNLCKDQTTHLIKRPNSLKKNIKRYISEVTQNRRKKNTIKINQGLKIDTAQNSLNKTTTLSKSAKKDISIFVSKQTRTLQQLIPIHHTKAYFYGKEPLRKSYDSIFDSPLNQEISKQVSMSFSQYPSIQSKPQSPLQIQADEDEQAQQFEGKFQQHQKFLNVKGHITKLHSKKKLFLRGSKKKQTDEQINEISPWKRRRNTVDSQPPID